MFGLENLSLPGLDWEAGSVTLPLWAAGGALGLLLLLFLLALFRAKFADALGSAVKLAALAFAVWVGWTYVEQSGERDRDAGRHALNMRATELASRVMAPQSALACLDGITGEAVEVACERAIFASPESVSAASSYVAAKLSLFQDAVDFVNRRDPAYAGALIGLRRTIETDRFGLVAHVLASREGCTAEQCSLLSLLRDPDRIKGNLRERTFEIVVARHVDGWPSRTRPPGSVSASGASPIPGPGVSFPSAASIPPVSIMNNEPPGAPPQAAPPPAQRGPAQAAPAAAQRPRPAAPKQAAPKSNAPVQIAPSQ